MTADLGFINFVDAVNNPFPEFDGPTHLSGWDLFTSFGRRTVYANQYENLVACMILLQLSQPSWYVRCVCERRRLSNPTVVPSPRRATGLGPRSPIHGWVFYFVRGICALCRPINVPAVLFYPIQTIRPQPRRVAGPVGLPGRVLAVDRCVSTPLAPHSSVHQKCGEIPDRNR